MHVTGRRSVEPESRVDGCFNEAWSFLSSRNSITPSANLSIRASALCAPAATIRVICVTLQSTSKPICAFHWMERVRERERKEGEPFYPIQRRCDPYASCFLFNEIWFMRVINTVRSNDTYPGYKATCASNAFEVEDETNFITDLHSHLKICLLGIASFARSITESFTSLEGQKFGVRCIARND